MNVLYIILITLIILFFGYWTNLAKRKENIESLNFVSTYYENFNILFSGHVLGKPINYSEALNWLTKNMAQVQEILVRQGITASFQAPFSNYIIKNYQVAINGLSEILSFDNSWGLEIERENAFRMAQFIFEMTQMSIGLSENNIKDITKRMKNPIALFIDGLREIVYIPLTFFQLAGLISVSSYNRVKKSLLGKWISFLVGIAGFVGSIFGIISGWSAVRAFIIYIIGKF